MKRRHGTPNPSKPGDPTMQSGEFHSAHADHLSAVATFGAPTWAPLLPPSIVAVGGADQPVERLLTLQSAIARAAHIVTLVGRLRPRLHLNGLPTVRFR
jgi:hypothetical protein